MTQTGNAVVQVRRVAVVLQDGGANVICCKISPTPSRNAEREGKKKKNKRKKEEN